MRYLLRRVSLEVMGMQQLQKCEAFRRSSGHQRLTALAKERATRLLQPFAFARYRPIGRCVRRSTEPHGRPEEHLEAAAYVGR